MWLIADCCEMGCATGAEYPRRLAVVRTKDYSTSKENLMSKVILALLFAALMSCNDRETEVDVSVEDLDSLGNKIENKLEKAADTVKATVNRWEDSLDNDRDDTSKY